MAVIPVIEYPDNRLRQQSLQVENFDESLLDSVGHFFETLYTSGGIGLSAPQLADFRRILVMDLSEDRSAPEVFVNPQIVAGARPAWVEESCLSVPGVVGNVVRDTRIRVRARDQFGGEFERDLEDMHAVCLQHELDHLDGTLFVDRLPLLHRLKFRLSQRLGARKPGRDDLEAGGYAPTDGVAADAEALR